MSDVLHIDQTAKASLVAQDLKGNPVTLDSFSFTSSDPTIATISADGSVVTPVALGNTTIHVDAVYKGAHFTADDVLTVDAGTLATLKIVITVNP